jgi:DNA-binding SARP family transcriptional activator
LSSTCSANHHRASVAGETAGQPRDRVFGRHRTAIAEILQPRHPDQALSALETALGHDPYNEYLYVRIMRLQAAAGRPEAVQRTLALLESRLTDLGLTPSPQTRQAAASLLHAPGP